MPTPFLVSRTILASGRKIYRDGAGKFISEKAYNLAKRRDPLTGRFLSKAVAAKLPDRNKIESTMRHILGKPPEGWTWTKLAAKYPTKFEEIFDEAA